MIAIVDTALKQGGIVLMEGGEIKEIHHISSLTTDDMAKLLIYPIYAESVQLFGMGKMALANKYEAKGILLGIAACNNVPITWIPAKEWQKALGFQKGKMTDYQWKKFLWQEASKIVKCSKEAADAVLIASYVKRLSEKGS